MVDSKEVESYYRKLWKKYRIGHDENFRRRRITTFIESWLTEAKREASELRLLDLGCGNGWLASHLQKYGTVDAADMEAEALEHARLRYPGVRFYKIELSEKTLGLDTGKYDIVVATEVIEHVKEKGAFLRTIRLLLKPEGLMVLTTPRGEFFDRWRMWVNDDFQPVEEWLSFDSLAQIVHEEGFTVLRHETLFYARHDSTLFDRLAGSFVGRQLRYFPFLYEKLFDWRGIYQAISAKKS